MRRHLSKDDGFTLIEFMVLLIIVGIIAAIALPVMANQREKANGGHNYDVSDPVGSANLSATFEDRFDGTGNYPYDVTSNFENSLRGQLDTPEDFGITTPVGGSICYSAQANGVSAAWNEFQGSSYDEHDQILVFNAALEHLC